MAEAGRTKRGGADERFPPDHQQQRRQLETVSAEAGDREAMRGRAPAAQPRLHPLLHALPELAVRKVSLLTTTYIVNY